MADTTSEWRSQVDSMIESVQEDRPGPRSLLVVGDAAVLPDDLTDTCRVAVARSEGTCVGVDCVDAGWEPYRPLRGILDRILPIVHAEAADLVDQLDAELIAVHPSLAGSLGVVAARTLDEVANTPSERRSHRESERAFRIVNGIARLLHGALEQCPGLKAGPLVLSWPDLHAADAATILTFRRLSRWANQEQSRLVLVASLDPERGPAGVEPSIPAEVAPCFGWREHHRRLLSDVRAQSLAEELVLDTVSRLNIAAAAAPGDDRAVPAAPGATTADTAAPADTVAPDDAGLIRRALAAFGGGRPEKGCALALRAMAPAAFALDYAAVLLLAAHIVAAADEPAFDETAFLQAWQDSSAADQHPALEFAVTPPRNRLDLVGAAWRAAGFANSCLGEHETALSCYQRAGRVARNPQERAQAKMYLGLITGKRLHRTEEAEAHIAAGIAELADETDLDSVLERCWLLNVNALVAYSQGRSKDAMRMAKEAWTTVRAVRSSEATHLKVNLVSNISVLYEQASQPTEAIKVWEKFRALLGRANELFAKHYHFREAGLRLAAGRLPEALDSYQASFAQCETTKDPFHGQLVAEACAHVEYRRGRQAQATAWCERAVDAARVVGDHERLPELRATLAALGAGAAPPDGTLLATPPTKLNRPFDLVNTVRLRAAG